VTSAPEQRVSSIRRWIEPAERRPVSALTLLVLIVAVPTVYLAVLFIIFGSDHPASQ
jgi:hypothetical protein